MPKELKDADYLRNLAERIMYVSGMDGNSQEQANKLRDEANKLYEIAERLDPGESMDHPDAAED